MTKGERLQEALTDAQQFHKTSHALLEWLTDTECALRSQASLPDDETAVKKLIDSHRKLLDELREKEVELQDCLAMGDAIVAKCHPEALATMKHWISILKSRWDEVSISAMLYRYLHVFNVKYSLLMLGRCPTGRSRTSGSCVKPSTSCVTRRRCWTS